MVLRYQVEPDDELPGGRLELDDVLLEFDELPELDELELDELLELDDATCFQPLSLALNCVPLLSSVQARTRTLSSPMGAVIVKVYDVEVGAIYVVRLL